METECPVMAALITLIIFAMSRSASFDLGLKKREGGEAMSNSYSRSVDPTLNRCHALRQKVSPVSAEKLLLFQTLGRPTNLTSRPCGHDSISLFPSELYWVTRCFVLYLALYV